MGITVGGEHLENAILHFKNREVEGAAAQIINRHPRLVLELIKTIGKRGGSRLVNNPHNLQTSELSCSLGRCTLPIVKIRRNRNNRL